MIHARLARAPVALVAAAIVSVAPMGSAAAPSVSEHGPNHPPSTRGAAA
jgi:hypothetical protein